MTEWAVGQKVAKVPHYREHLVEGPFEVVKVAGRKVTLDDGSAWVARSGHQWGYGNPNWYTGPVIRIWTDSHAAQADAYKRRQAAGALCDLIRKASLTWKQIATIKAALEPEA